MRSILQTNRFGKSLKKLHSQQKKHLDNAVKLIANDPTAGTKKVGDLADVYIYKFKINNQLMLLAYSFDDESLTLLAFGSHENFYRDLKRLK